MFNGIVFGGVGRVVGNANLKGQLSGQSLEILFEEIMTSIIAASSITKQQEMSEVGIMDTTIMMPPVTNRVRQLEIADWRLKN